MKTLLIVYHSQSGSSARLAAAAATGARREDVAVSVKRAWDAGTDDLVAADGLLLVAAENSGSLSGAAKDFLDRTFYPSIARELVLPYALLLSAGNDGRGAQKQAERIFRGYPFVAATEPMIVRGEPDGAQLTGCEEFGQAFAAGLQMGIF